MKRPAIVALRNRHAPATDSLRGSLRSPLTVSRPSLRSGLTNSPRPSAPPHARWSVWVRRGSVHRTVRGSRPLRSIGDHALESLPIKLPHVRDGQPLEHDDVAGPLVRGQSVCGPLETRLANESSAVVAVVTAATTSDPLVSWSLPATAAFATSGWVFSTSSTSAGAIRVTTGLDHVRASSEEVERAVVGHPARCRRSGRSRCETPLRSPRVCRDSPRRATATSRRSRRFRPGDLLVALPVSDHDIGLVDRFADEPSSITPRPCVNVSRVWVSVRP